MALFNQKEPYKFKEYPKHVDGKLVGSAEEESALKAPSQPSAADLDATVAALEDTKRAKEATSGKVRQIKGK